MASNFDLMNNRLYYRGGDQDKRMIKDKLHAFHMALLYSYQAAEIQKLDDEYTYYRVLINPDKNKPDYDDKILSVDYKYGFAAGDVFKWVGTDTYWLIYLQEHTEDAYFRSEIRRCRYKIGWLVDGELKSTYAYVRGPVETKVDYIQKGGISVDNPNWSLNIYVPRNEDNLAKFKRYDKFMLDGTTWEIQAVDRISTDGIIQVVALEYFTNPTLDNKDINLNDAFIITPVVENEEGEKVPIKDLVSEITGETFIMPSEEYEYTCGDNSGTWSIKEKNRPVKIVGNKVTWTKLTSGQFTLVYTSTDGEPVEKVIVAESLF